MATDGVATVSYSGAEFQTTIDEAVRLVNAAKSACEAGASGVYALTASDTGERVYLTLGPGVPLLVHGRSADLGVAESR